MTATHPKSPHPFFTVHAELAAILNAVNRAGFRKEFETVLHGCRIYIHRIKADGTDGLAKPCQHCQRLLNSVGITKIEYSEG